MDLKTYLQQNDGAAATLAQALDIQVPYLQQMALPDENPNKRAVNPVRAVHLEKLTSGLVRRWDTRPKDWHLIWPELIGTDGAPEVTAEQDA